jgi:hypothetical protein
VTQRQQLCSFAAARASGQERLRIFLVDSHLEIRPAGPFGRRGSVWLLRADGVEVGLPLTFQVALGIGKFDLSFGQNGEHGVEFLLVVSDGCEGVGDPLQVGFNARKAPFCRHGFLCVAYSGAAVSGRLLSLAAISRSFRNSHTGSSSYMRSRLFSLWPALPVL